MITDLKIEYVVFTQITMNQFALLVQRSHCCNYLRENQNRPKFREKQTDHAHIYQAVEFGMRLTMIYTNINCLPQQNKQWVVQKSKYSKIVNLK